MSSFIFNRGKGCCRELSQLFKIMPKYCIKVWNNIKRYKTYCKNKSNEYVRRKTDRGPQKPIPQNY